MSIGLGGSLARTFLFFLFLGGNVFTFLTVTVIVGVVVCILVFAFMMVDDYGDASGPAGVMAAIIAIATICAYIPLVLLPHQQALSNRALADLQAQGYRVISVWAPPDSAWFKQDGCNYEYNLKKQNGHYVPYSPPIDFNCKVLPSPG